jgi:hypothetical protein
MLSKPGLRVEGREDKKLGDTNIVKTRSIKTSNGASANEENMNGAVSMGKSTATSSHCSTANLRLQNSSNGIGRVVAEL